MMHNVCPAFLRKRHRAQAFGGLIQLDTQLQYPVLLLLLLLLVATHHTTHFFTTSIDLPHHV